MIECCCNFSIVERLRREINVFCYRRLVDSVSIFKDMPQHIIVDIVNSLKPEIFLPNDIIVKAGTIGECMYFLASGTVCVVTPTGREVFLVGFINVFLIRMPYHVLTILGLPSLRWRIFWRNCSNHERSKANRKRYCYRNMRSL